MSNDTVEYYIDPTTVADDTRFDEATLNDAIRMQASLVAHYGTLVGKAQMQMDRFKHMMEITEAKVARDVRNEASSVGKKLTEKMIDQEVMLSPSMIKRRRLYNEAKAHYETVRSAYEAVRHKKDMLIQGGVQRRIEMEGEARLGYNTKDMTERAKEAAKRSLSQ